VNASTDRQLMLQMLRSDFNFFVAYFFPVVRPEIPFDNAWYVQALCHALSSILTTSSARVIINLPPRALKSTIASVLFPAWYLGRKPEKRVLCASYNDQLSKTFSRDFALVVKSPMFRAAFPRFRLGSKVAEGEIATTLNGYRLATSVGGMATGRGADLIIVDDPINASETGSEAERTAVKDWFDKSIQGRLDRQGEGHILVVMQRLHEDDLSGHLLQKESGWRLIRIPIRNTGPKRHIAIGHGRTYVWPEGADMMPAIMNRQEQERFKAEIGERTFSAQYLQEPLPAGGVVFKVDWIRTCADAHSLSSYRAVVLSFDVAVKPDDSADYSVCTVWGVARDRVYHLLDVHRVRLPYYKVLALARDLIARYKATHVLVEDAANGMALAQELARNSLYATVPIRPKVDKLSRAQAATPAFEAGRVLLPEKAHWRHAYLHELTGFPGTRYDDQVDSTSQFINWAEERFSSPDINPIPWAGEKDDSWMF
jgi:predicted phage terminase large subunit-like protein